MTAGERAHDEFSKVGRILKRIRSDYLGVAVIVGVFGTGLGVGWVGATAFADAWDLPERVEDVEERLGRVEYRGMRSGIMIRAFCQDPPNEETQEACNIVEFLDSQRDVP